VLRPTTQAADPWTILRMELRHLRYFVAVAEELHFRRAAERLHVAQPAVSEQIRKLECELGVQLFNRTQRTVTLTPPGQAMLGEARRVLRQAEAAQMAARHAADEAKSRLRVGYLSDSLPANVSRAMRMLTASSPLVQISLETGPALGLVEAVRSDQLDVAVVGLPAPTRGLRATPAGHEGVVAALPVTHPLATGAPAPIERLAPERLVSLPRDTNPAFHNAVISMCRDAGLSPTIVELAEPRVEQALMAVATGAGMALLPESAAEHYGAPGVRMTPVQTPAPILSSVVVTRPDAEELATAAFLRALGHADRPGAQRDARSPVALAA
jgi:DNA-binding transcriptional LysR family regulator